MKLRNLLFASLAVLGFVALTAGPASAILVGINIEVFKNGVSQGTAFGGASTSTNTPFIVTASTGDTLRFVVMLDSNPANNIASYGTNLPNLDANNGAGGSAEMRFSSATDLSGLGFVNIGNNPNSQLNDSTPGNGNANSPGGTVDAQLLYRVEYIVQTVVTDSLRDFNVVLTGYASSPGGDLLNSALDSASVRIDSGAAVVPEPASLLLLGSGLAGLLGFGRKKLRK